MASTHQQVDLTVVTSAEEGRLETLRIQRRDPVCLQKDNRVFGKATPSALIRLWGMESKFQSQSSQGFWDLTSQEQPYSKQENLIAKIAIRGSPQPHRIPSSSGCVSSRGDKTSRLVISRLPGASYSHISLLKGSQSPTFLSRTWQLIVISDLTCTRMNAILTAGENAAAINPGPKQEHL